MEGNIRWMRLILIMTSFFTAFVMILPRSFYLDQFIFSLDSGVLNIIWVIAYYILGAVGTFNLVNKDSVDIW